MNLRKELIGGDSTQVVEALGESGTMLVSERDVSPGMLEVKAVRRIRVQGMLELGHASREGCVGQTRATVAQAGHVLVACLVDPGS